MYSVRQEEQQETLWDRYDPVAGDFNALCLCKTHFKVIKQGRYSQEREVGKGEVLPLML